MPALSLADVLQGVPAAPSLECQRGVPQECARRGAAAFASDPVRAAGEHAEACRRGHSDSCNELGRLYYAGQGVARDATRAAVLFSSACDANILAGCANLGVMLADGDGVPVDAPRAVTLLARGCDGGFGRACGRLGAMYMHGAAGVAADASRAARFLDMACQRDVASACTDLGYLFDSGLGVAADPRRALALYEQGCTGGNGVGCSNAALLLVGGIGEAAPDQPRARALFLRACDLSFARGCQRAGDMVSAGEGGPAERSRAIELYVRGCDLGSGRACNLAGLAYGDGDGVERDPVRSAQLLERACDRGEAAGCNNFALCLQNGDGTDVDIDRAQQLFDRACSAGDQWGCGNLGQMLCRQPPIEGRSTQARRRAAERETGARHIAEACEAGLSHYCSPSCDELAALESCGGVVPLVREQLFRTRSRLDLLVETISQQSQTRDAATIEALHLELDNLEVGLGEERGDLERVRARCTEAQLTALHELSSGIDETLDRVAAARDQLGPVPRPATGAIAVITDVRSAEVRINGQPIPGGMRDGLAPGTYVVQVLAPGYATLRREVRVEAGQTTSIDAALAPDPSVPESPSRDEVIAAMSAVAGSVSACGAGRRGTVTVAVSVDGTTGRVTSATVSGELAGTPVASCIAREVRGAVFPRFRRATFTVNYPFRIGQ